MQALPGFEQAAIAMIAPPQPGVTVHPGVVNKMCGPCGDQAMGPEARAVSHMRRAIKSGSINQGYAQCDVDQLAILVESGQCSPERIQCRQVATLRALGLAGGATATFLIDPVGPSFARELLTVFNAPTDPVGGPDFLPVLIQLASQGKTAVTGQVTSTVAGNIPTGTALSTWGPNFQNYVLPSGISFNSSNELVVTITNVGVDPGTFVCSVTYDLIRAG